MKKGAKRGLGFDVSYEMYYLNKAFPKSYLCLDTFEIIVEPKANEYFLLEDCKTKKDVQAKVLEWLSRGACKTEPYQIAKNNKAFREYMQNGINEYLETNFSQEDFEMIYQKLGNRVNHELTIKFIKSNFNMKVLERGKE